MSNLEASKINHENHLYLDQFLLRLPYELLRKNFRSAHLAVEKESVSVKNLLKETATGSINGKLPADDVVKNLDAMLARMRGMKRKLAAYADEEAGLYRQVDARAAHLRALDSMHTVEDVQYVAWSRCRLDRLLVDYLLRNGFNASAQALAEQRGMQDLVDIDTFVTMDRIHKSLLQGSVQEALVWCGENKKELRKMESKLEFGLRCQQFVELLRSGAASKAIEHAKKFLAPYRETYRDDVIKIAGLLAHRPNTTIEPYADLYSQSQWTTLAEQFIEAHNQLLGLPPVPLLHTALSSGLSALKTPACHGRHMTSASQPARGAGLGTSMCPICSTELNELARNVPYAHHSKSHVEHDLRLLPNSRVYGKARLEEYAAKAGLPPGQVRDLVTGNQYSWGLTRKVFIT